MSEWRTVWTIQHKLTMLVYQPLGTAKRWWPYFAPTGTKLFSIERFLELAFKTSYWDLLTAPLCLITSPLGQKEVSCLAFLQDIMCQQGTNGRQNFCFPFCRLKYHPSSSYRSWKSVFCCDLPSQLIYAKKYNIDTPNNGITSPKDPKIHKLIPTVIQ